MWSGAFSDRARNRHLGIVVRRRARLHLRPLKYPVGPQYVSPLKWPIAATTARWDNIIRSVPYFFIGAIRPFFDVRCHKELNRENTAKQRTQPVIPLRGLAFINRKGYLFVLVGAVTFSAAMNNAAQFRSQSAALLVGQTIGEKPNSYAEPRDIMLPSSHLTVRCSTRYYKFSEGGENAIRADREIIPSRADYPAGRGPVLEGLISDPKRLGGGA